MACKPAPDSSPRHAHPTVKQLLWGTVPPFHKALPWKEQGWGSKGPSLPHNTAIYKPLGCLSHFCRSSHFSEILSHQRGQKWKMRTDQRIHILSQNCTREGSAQQTLLSRGFGGSLLLSPLSPKHGPPVTEQRFETTTSLAGHREGLRDKVQRVLWRWV